MSDGISDSWKQIEQTPEQEMQHNLRLLDYHYIEMRKIIQDIKKNSKK